MPDLKFEMQYDGPVCGVDEAGRGPLAGPVVAAAAILPEGWDDADLNDSKILSEKKRERLYDRLIAEVEYGIGIAEPVEIDRYNILWASMRAMSRAVDELKTPCLHALIDGNRVPRLDIPATAIVKGDSKSASIAAASIIAKQTRDRLMVRADRLWPAYGFAGHKGYPTKSHRNAIAQNGPCPIHRLSFKLPADLFSKHG